MKSGKQAIILKTILYFSLLIIWLAVLSFIRHPHVLREKVYDRLNTSGVYPGDTEPTIKVYGDITVSQSFKPKNKWDSVRIFIRNNEDTYEGDYKVTLTDDDGEVVSEWTGRKFDIGEDGTWIPYNLKKAVAADGRRYTVTVSAPELEAYNCIILTASSAVIKRGGLVLSGVNQDRLLYLKIERTRFNVVALAVYIIFALTVIFWWINRNKTVERLAPGLIIGMGLCFMLMMAPLAQPDDEYHYQSSLMLSNAIMGRNDLGVVEAEYSDYTDLTSHVNSNQSYLRALHDLRHPRRVNSDSVYLYRTRDSLYMPLVYVPQALGITLGRLLKLNFSYTYYLGRLFSLLFYCLMVVTAIRIIPQKKLMVLLCSLFPMLLQQATSYSYDTIINGASFIFFAYIVKLCSLSGGKKVEWRDVVILGLLGGLFSPIKIIYIVSVLAVLIIPRSSFSSRKDKILKSCTILIITVAFVLLTEYPTILAILSGQQLDVNAGRYTITNMMQMPVESIRILLQSVDTQLWALVCQMIGSLLAGLNVFIPDYIIAGFLLSVLMSLTRTKGDPELLNRRQKSLLLFIALVEMFCSFLGMMIGWTKFGEKQIKGVQGRYFIPFLLPLLLAIENRKVVREVSEKKIMGVYWFLEMTVIASVFDQIQYL